MSIKVLPRSLANKMAPKKVVEKLVTQNLTVNRATVTMLERSGVMSKRALTDVAVKVINGYKKAARKKVKAGLSKRTAVKDAVAGKKLMVQRVQSALTSEITAEVRAKYRGEFYIWLPSGANEPRPEHQLNYGKTFQLGKGEEPGDEPGCQCGMEILVDETRLNLE